MALITGEELARGLIVGTLGGAAGLCVVAFPGSALWLAPAALAVGGCALTVPEVRAELAPIVAHARPLLADAQQRLGDAAWQLPGVRRALPAPAERGAPDDARPAGASVTLQPEPAQARRPAAATRERPRWLSILNDEPDQRPHALILGPTRSGKTTMATAAMADRGGRAIVITPKVNPSNWRGAEIVTLDEEGGYRDIGQALADIEIEKRERIGRLRRGEPLEPLTIVYDEIGELAAFAPLAPEQMTQLSSIGAELKMRVIGIGTSDEALGIKRWKATRNNYIRVETNTDRGATIHDGVRSLSVRPRESLALAERATLRPWRGEPEPATRTTTNLRAPAESDPLLAELLAQQLLASMSPERAARLQAIQAGGQSVSVAHEGGDVIVNVAQVAAAPSTRRRASIAGGVDVRARRERAEKMRQIRRYVAEGKSANEIDKLMPGERKEILRLVREIKGGSGGS